MISLLSKRLSRVFSSTTIRKHIYIYMRETDRKTERDRDRDFKELAYVIVGADRSKISRED